MLPDGYAAVKWLVYESKLDLSSLKYKVHSANPIASVQIDSLLKNYKKHLWIRSLEEQLALVKNQRDGIDAMRKENMESENPEQDN